MNNHSNESRRIQDVSANLLGSMMTCGAHLTEQHILNVLSQFDGRSKVEDLENAISMLEQLIANGHDNICVRSILKSKRNILKDYFISPTNTPPSSDDEEDFDDPVDCETSLQVDCQGNMTILDPITSSNIGFVSEIDDNACESFGNGILIDDCCLDCNTQQLSVQSLDLGNGIGTRHVPIDSVDNLSMPAVTMHNIDERYLHHHTERPLRSIALGKSELSGIGSGSADESFQSGIVTADCAQDGKAQPVSAESLYENSASAASLGNIDEKNLVHPISRSLGTSCFDHSELCGVDVECRTNLLIQGVILEKWCTLRTLGMFLSLLLVGLCAATSSGIGSHLASEANLEEQRDFQQSSMRLTIEKENIRYLNGTGRSSVSSPLYKEYPYAEVLQNDADERQQHYLQFVFGSFTDYDAFSTTRQISGTIESHNISEYPGQVHSTLKTVQISDLDGTVLSGGINHNRVLPMILSLMPEELCVRWYLYLFFSIPPIVFLSLRYFAYNLLHALYMLGSSIQSSFTMVCSVKNDYRLCLLLRARVAIGFKRIERMPYCKLIQLHNSHVPLFYLETSRQLSGTNKLCRIMKEASLSDLSYLNNASDLISRHVELVLSQNWKYVKQQRLWERISSKFNPSYFDDHTIERFQLLLLLLSVFETTDKDIKTVILYGVPGLPSVTVSVTATYAEIRTMIVKRFPNLRNFYFIAHGRIIHIEETVIDWRSGHLVLNVHTTSDLPGGSMPGSSDSGSSDRTRNKVSDLQSLLFSDASGEEDSDDSISLGVSDSDSIQDSDSSWELQKYTKQGRKRRNTKQSNDSYVTANNVSAQRNREDSKSIHAEQIIQSDASGDEGLDGSTLLGICDSETSQDNDSSCYLDRNRKRNNDISVQRNTDARNIKSTERTTQSDASTDVCSDESVSLGVSDSESLQDSDSSFCLEKNKKRKQRILDANKRRGTARTKHDVDIQSNLNANKRRGTARTKHDIDVQSKLDANKRRGTARTKHEVDVKKTTNSKREKKPVPVEYDQYSQQPPTRAQCEDSGRHVWNAVGAFYASQPPPPERTMPYFESLFCRPFLVQLLSAAITKLDPADSELETDFDYVRNMLHTVSLFNEYSELLDVVGDYDVDNPVPLETLRLHVQHLQAKTVASQIVDLVRDLLLLLEDYRQSFESEIKKGTKLRQVLIKKMVSSIEKVKLSGTVSAEQFYTMYDDYQGLKDRCCKICTVCGVRRPAAKLNDAVPFFTCLRRLMIWLISTMLWLTKTFQTINLENLHRDATILRILMVNCTTFWILMRNCMRTVQVTMMGKILLKTLAFR